MAQKSMRKPLLSLSIATVLTCSWSGSVFADVHQDPELYARIAELEALVEQLLQNQQVEVEVLEAEAVEIIAAEAAEVAA